MAAARARSATLGRCRLRVRDCSAHGQRVEVQVEVGPVADTRFEDDLGRSARRDMLYIYFKTGVPKPPAIEVDTVMEILCVSDQIADF